MNLGRKAERPDTMRPSTPPPREIWGEETEETDETDDDTTETSMRCWMDEGTYKYVGRIHQKGYQSMVNGLKTKKVNRVVYSSITLYTLE